MQLDSNAELEALVLTFRKYYFSTCFYCGRAVISRRVQIYVDQLHQRTTDHVIPRSKGGSEKSCNKVLACRECNLAKGNMTIEEFRWARYGSATAEFFFETDIRRRMANLSLHMIGKLGD